VARKLATILIEGLLTLVLICRSARAASPEQVQFAIDRARAFLYSQRNSDGNWEDSPKPLSDKTPYDPAGGQWGGLSALATYSLLAAGESPRDPRLVAAIRFLETADVRGIYALGLRAQIWGYLPMSPLVHAAIERDGRLLLRTTPTPAGMYGYLSGAAPDPQHIYDHSVSQYGVLGMWALQEAGLEVPDQYWAAVDAAWRRDQLADGAWSYYAQPNGEYPATVTLTAAGVASLYLTDDDLRGAAGLECQDDLGDADIERGLAWIGGHFDSVFDSPNRPCYALYGIERIGAASGRQSFGADRWFDKGADFLVRAQNAETGAWDEKDGAVADTALGLLFLARGRAPVVMNKLNYSTPGATAAWDRRPRDLAHLTRWISNTIEARRALNWQIVDIDGNPDDWHDAPILFICGSQALRLSPDQEAKLARFVQDGGLILFNSDCGRSDAFEQSVRDLGRRLFHAEFRPLPANHPIYTNEEFYRRQWAQPPEVLGLSNGARELMIMVPDADLSAAWQVNAQLLHPEAFQLGADIFLYAMDKENLRFKGQSYLVKADPNIATSRTIKLARLNYGLGWDPEPGGWRRMAAVMHNRDGVDLDVTAVQLGDGSLAGGGFNVAHMTGSAAFTMSAAAREEIRRFVGGGGTLIVDAAGGSRAFADSARAQLTEIFGDQARQLATPMHIENPFYSSGSDKMRGRDIAYRPFARHVLSEVRQPRLRGLFLNSRLCVYFSAEDISVGLGGEPIDGIVGYQPSVATKLMERMILGF
jgi:hypothetical protein